MNNLSTTSLPQGGAGGGSGEAVTRVKRTPTLIVHAKTARKNQTEPEKRLWRALKTWQLNNHKFRRQEVIGNYIVDFVCHEQGLIIEIDGDSHVFSISYDNKRTEVLKGLGFKVLRFWNNEVMENFDGVLEKIIEVLAEKSPSLEGRGLGAGPGEARHLEHRDPPPTSSLREEAF